MKNNNKNSNSKIKPMENTQTIIQKTETKRWPPYHVLKPEIKKIIKTNNVLQGSIMQRFDISFSTLIRWLDTDDLRATSYTFLLLVWDFVSELYPEYKKLTDLLTIDFEK